MRRRKLFYTWPSILKWKQVDPCLKLTIIGVSWSFSPQETPQCLLTGQRQYLELSMKYIFLQECFSDCEVESRQMVFPPGTVCRKCYPNIPICDQSHRFMAPQLGPGWKHNTGIANPQKRDTYFSTKWIYIRRIRSSRLKKSRIRETKHL